MPASPAHSNSSTFLPPSPFQAPLCATAALSAATHSSHFFYAWSWNCWRAQRSPSYLGRSGPPRDRRVRAFAYLVLPSASVLQICRRHVWAAPMFSYALAGCAFCIMIAHDSYRVVFALLFARWQSQHLFICVRARAYSTRDRQVNTAAHRPSSSSPRSDTASHLVDFG